eukprot:CAMPEP_0171110964 /NCGR_PEP_ID=MMETSP0766_2-20121228/73171_1 /TAXON_ID=439317 /ORGANISM="Gambierdiscus australes, Strain CAWD 149" /LENGTH=66 /DNA_ID=CAMNT_0011572895 /DNA_START=80 /DNA_END=275 /DNA_ORIENTATION=+
MSATAQSFKVAPWPALPQRLLRLLAAASAGHTQVGERVWCSCLTAGLCTAQGEQRALADQRGKSDV